jgi:hypothetical protein
LRADGVGKQGIIAFDPGLAVDTQSLGIAVHRNEQKSDVRVDRKVADALEHAVTVIVGKR